MQDNVDKLRRLIKLDRFVLERHILSIHILHNKVSQGKANEPEKVFPNIFRWNSTPVHENIGTLMQGEWAAEAGNMAISCKFIQQSQHVDSDCGSVCFSANREDC